MRTIANVFVTICLIMGYNEKQSAGLKILKSTSARKSGSRLVLKKDIAQFPKSSGNCLAKTGAIKIFVVSNVDREHDEA